MHRAHFFIMPGVAVARGSADECKGRKKDDGTAQRRDGLQGKCNQEGKMELQCIPPVPLPPPRPARCTKSGPRSPEGNGSAHPAMNITSLSAVEYHASRRKKKTRWGRGGGCNVIEGGQGVPGDDRRGWRASPWTQSSRPLPRRPTPVQRCRQPLPPQ